MKIRKIMLLTMIGIFSVFGFSCSKTGNEKQVLFDILNEYMEGKNNQKDVIECINTLLKKYPNEYLEKSTLLTGE